MTMYRAYIDGVELTPIKADTLSLAEAKAKAQAIPPETTTRYSTLHIVGHSVQTIRVDPEEPDCKLDQAHVWSEAGPNRHWCRRCRLIRYTYPDRVKYQ